MTVRLNAPYQGTPAGVTLTFPTSTEVALIGNLIATSAALATTTTGAQSSSAMSGVAAIAAGTSSVVITNPNIDANSHVTASIRQAAADATLLRIERVVPAAGSVTLFGTANATATTLVSWSIVNGPGLSVTT